MSIWNLIKLGKEKKIIIIYHNQFTLLIENGDQNLKKVDGNSYP